MRQPEGYVQPGSPHKVCRLNRSLYGLKQATRVWYFKFQTYLLSLGFSHIKADSNVYIQVFTKDFILLALYVDDVISVSNNLSLITKIKMQLFQAFEMTGHGSIHYDLGIHIERNRLQRTITIHQKKYILSILQCFNMINCHPISTPLEVNMKLFKS